ncbi:MAG: hypothetical protein IPJ13_20470 [Saprospiraceae bacterium]|nr:hypothetical protein [Saprospiraceae bacterium]
MTVIYGDIIHENKISGRKTSHHHFTLIDVPVSLGFEKVLVPGLQGLKEVSYSIWL